MDTPAIVPALGKKMNPIVGFILLVLAIVIAIHAATAIDNAVAKWKRANAVKKTTTTTATAPDPTDGQNG